MAELKKVKTKLSNYVPTMMRQAAADLRAVEKADGYRVNMARWHKGGHGKPCDVCVGGASLARRYGVAPTEYVLLCDFDKPTGSKLRAIDLLRRGCVFEARWWNADIPESVPDRDMPDYHEDREGFYKGMELTDRRNRNRTGRGAICRAWAL